MDLEAMGFDFTAGLDCPSSSPEAVPDCSDVINKLEQASAKGDLGVIKHTFATLRSIPGSDIHHEHPGSSLFLAVKNNHKRVVKFFLHEGVKPEVNHIKIATIDKNVSLLEMFLQNGWGINNQLSWAEPPAFCLAIEDECITSWFLTHGADPNATCQSGLTPLAVAVEYAPFNIIKLLFDSGGSNKSRNLIHHAARREADDRLNVLEYILERGGRVNINHVMFADDPTRYELQRPFALGTPLHNAARHGHIEIVQMLVKNGADPRIKDSRGDSVIEQAKWSNQAQVVEYLRSLEMEWSDNCNL